MKILIHVEEIRSCVGFECTERLTHINSRDRQIKLAPVVGFEPTTRLRRINSQASIGVLQNAHEECIQSLKIGSSGRIRTYDQSVNSRPLYH